MDESPTKFKCPKCGATLMVSASADHTTCVWCGASIPNVLVKKSEIQPVASNEELVNADTSGTRQNEAVASVGEDTVASGSTLPAYAAQSIPLSQQQKVNFWMLVAGGAFVFPGICIFASFILELTFFGLIEFIYGKFALPPYGSCRLACGYSLLRLQKPALGIQTNDSRVGLGDCLRNCFINNYIWLALIRRRAHRMRSYSNANRLSSYFPCCARKGLG